MELTTKEAIEYVILKVEEDKKVPFKKVPESELDSIWIEFESGGNCECSLVGRVDMYYEVWFMVEDDGSVHTDTSDYTEALKAFRSLILTKTFSSI